MFLNTDYVTPAELTGFARGALQDLQINQFTLSQWLPNREVDDLTYRFTRGGEGLTESAVFRSYDAESPIGARPGVTRVTGELPPLSQKIRLGEYERLRQRGLDAELRGAIEGDAKRMTRAVAARIERARGESLYTGKVTISENGVIATADFGRSGSHTVTTGTAWSTVATATPLADLLTWRDTYISTNGEPPGAILLGTQTLGYLLRNAEIRTLAATVAGSPAIVSRSTVDSVLQAYGLPPIYLYDAQTKVSGVATRVIPADKVLLLPAPGASDLGATVYGTTAEALSPDFAISQTEAPGIVAGAYDTKDPVAVWTKASAIALPVLANPDLTFTADVIP